MPRSSGYWRRLGLLLGSAVFQAGLAQPQAQAQTAPPEASAPAETPPERRSPPSATDGASGMDPRLRLPVPGAGLPPATSTPGLSTGAGAGQPPTPAPSMGPIETTP